MSVLLSFMVGNEGQRYIYSFFFIGVFIGMFYCDTTVSNMPVLYICMYFYNFTTVNTALLHYLREETDRRNKEMTSNRCNDITGFRVHS